MACSTSRISPGSSRVPRNNRIGKSPTCLWANWSAGQSLPRWSANTATLKRRQPHSASIARHSTTSSSAMRLCTEGWLRTSDPGPRTLGFKERVCEQSVPIRLWQSIHQSRQEHAAVGQSRRRVGRTKLNLQSLQFPQQPSMNFRPAQKMARCRRVGLIESRAYLEIPTFLCASNLDHGSLDGRTYRDLFPVFLHAPCGLVDLEFTAHLGHLDGVGLADQTIR